MVRVDRQCPPPQRRKRQHRRRRFGPDAGTSIRANREPSRTGHSPRKSSDNSPRRRVISRSAAGIDRALRSGQRTISMTGAIASGSASRTPSPRPKAIDQRPPGFGRLGVPSPVIEHRRNEFRQRIDVMKIADRAPVKSDKAAAEPQRLRPSDLGRRVDEPTFDGSSSKSNNVPVLGLVMRRSFCKRHPNPYLEPRILHGFDTDERIKTI